MQNSPSVSDAALIATATDWLVDSGLGGSVLAELVAGLCRRLNAGGVAVDRGGCSILTLHPQIVSQEVTWRSDDDRATMRYYTPKLMEDPDNRYGPYFDLALNRLRYKRFHLDEAGAGQDTPLLARLHSEWLYGVLGLFLPLFHRVRTGPARHCWRVPGSARMP
jgi:hypothetical protein